MWAALAKAKIDIPLKRAKSWRDSKIEVVDLVVRAGTEITITKGREEKYALWGQGAYIWDLNEEYVGEIIQSSDVTPVASHSSTSSNSIEEKKVQFGDSFEADFDEGTWTFKMQKDYSVWHGRFAIIPERELQSLLPNSEQEDKRSVATKSNQGGDAGNKKEWKGIMSLGEIVESETDSSKEEGKDELTDYGKAVRMAKRFHELYDEYAPLYGYNILKEPTDFNEDSPNGKLMISVCEQLQKENGLKGE